MPKICTCIEILAQLGWIIKELFIAQNLGSIGVLSHH